MTEKSKGLIETGEMVKALLNTKTGTWPAEPIDAGKAFKFQTRRIVKPQPPANARHDSAKTHNGMPFEFGWVAEDGKLIDVKVPHPVGTILYVKEAHAFEKRMIYYRADSSMISGDWKDTHPDLLAEFEKRKPGTIAKYTKTRPYDKPPSKWKSPIFMTRWASRIWLEVMRVRVEKFSSITAEDAIAEGVPKSYAGHLDIKTGEETASSRFAYKSLIESINGQDAWDKWGFAYDLKRLA